MNSLPQAPAEEAPLSHQVILQSQALQAPKIETPTLSIDSSSLEQAMRSSRWLTSQHQTDAVLNLAADWLRNGEPHLAPDPQVRRVLERFAAHHSAWSSSVSRVMAATPPGLDRESLQQVLEMLGHAGRVGEEVVRQSADDIQRTAQLARLLTPGSSAPFAYFKRAGSREPLRQCRSTDPGAIPLFLDPQAVLDPVVAAPSRFGRLKNKVIYGLQSWSRCRDYVCEAAYNAWYPYGGDDENVDKHA